MIVPKVARAVGVLAALSLAGCIVDATGESDEQPPVEEASWNLSQIDGEPPQEAGLDLPAGDGESNGDDGGDDGDGKDGEEDQQTNYVPPGVRVNDIADPHPDPWHTDSTTEASGSHD